MQGTVDYFRTGVKGALAMFVQHACFEGKKAEETSPRKNTPRTLQ
jgi:hypothetical protein